MSDTHAVISAFIDDEPFDAQALAAALSEPQGRELLIDLVALRHVTQPSRDAVFERPRRVSPLRAVLAAAAMLVAIAGGYALGQRQTSIDQSAAPAPTRVIEPSEGWQVLP
jgi:hypothetical protein